MMKHKIIIVFIFITVCIQANHFSILEGQKSSKHGYRTLLKSGSWNLKEAGYYYPKFSGAMVQVKASGVELDLHNYACENQSHKDYTAIGIEVGYSPVELQENSSLQQISNITIKNAALVNFDVGIIVHKGVQNITIENCSFNGVSIGLLILGLENHYGSSAAGIIVKHCSIIGHGYNHQHKLVMLKELIEKNVYGYGMDRVMSLDKDTLYNGSQNDVYTYAGIIAKHAYSLSIEDVNIQNIGYQGYEHLSEGDGCRTNAVGVLIEQGDTAYIKNTNIYSTASELNATGIKIVSTQNVFCRCLKIILQKSKNIACGIDAADANDYEERFSGNGKILQLHDIICRLNKSYTSDIDRLALQLAVGIRVNGFFSIDADKVCCEDNVGGKAAYGFWGKYLVDSVVKDSSFQKNKTNRAINDVVTSLGIHSVGFYLYQSDGVQLQGCTFSYNIGKNTGIGLHLEETDNMACQDCLLFKNHGLMSTAVEYGVSDIVGSIRHEQEEQIISLHGPIVSAACSGGYGMKLDTGYRIEIKKCVVKHNGGHRGIGIAVKGVDLLTVQESSVLYQYANGPFLHGDFQQTSSSSGVVSSIINLVNLVTSQQEDVVDRVSKFLSIINKMRSKWVQGTKLSSDDTQTLIQSFSYFYALIAKFRLWSVAIGIHIHDSSGVLLKRSNYSGQISEYDNAVGVMTTGYISDFYMEHCEASYNISWKDSVVEKVKDTCLYAEQYTLSSIVLFWDMIVASYSRALTKNDIGFYVQDNVLVAQGQKELDGSGNNVWVTITGDSNTYNYVNLIAPLAAGLVLSDVSTNGMLAHNTFHANKGCSGYCFGFLSHEADNFLVKDNKITDNNSNIYGQCWGLAEINIYPKNSYIQNYLSFNRVDGYYNAHTLLVTDHRNNDSDMYPKVEFNKSVIPTVLYDIHNIEIIFPMVSYKDEQDAKK